MTCHGRLRHAALMLSTALLGAGVASGQDPAHSLRGRVGVDAAATLMASQFVEDRLRGLERLGSAGTPRAVARLIRAIEPGGSATTAEERLTAVRVLSSFTDDVTVRRALARVLGGHATPSSTEIPPPLDALAEETAALALARSGTPDALATLGKALVTPGRGASAARLALVAHPPKDLDSVLRAATLSTLELATTLEQLADPRSEDALRRLVLGGASDVRAVAAVALAKIGEPEAVPLARQWLNAKSPAVLRVAGARVLTIAHEGDAFAAITALLDDDQTASDGIALALDSPNPALVSPLARRLATASTERARDVLTAVGRAGGAEAAKLLVARLSTPTQAATAADALGRMPGADATKALDAALGVRATRRLATRGGVVRKLVLGEQLRGLKAALAVLAASKDPVDRAVGLSASVALDAKRFETLLGAPFAGSLPGVAPLLLLEPQKVAIRVAARIADASSDETRTALAFALVVPGAEDEVPTAALVSLVDGSNAASPLAARALARRDEPRLRPAVTALLASPVSALRVHTALGLGRSSTPDATGLLESAYRFESDPDVRTAIARALAMRPERSNRTLALARDLDPDARVRRAARGAGAGQKSESATRGNEVVWITMTDGRPTAKAKTATVVTPDGLFLPVELGPDGQTLTAGLPEGSRVLRVAPVRDPDDDSLRGASGDEKSDHSQGSRRSP